MDADQILVLRHGREIEKGTHEELLQKNGIYRKIYDIQMNPDENQLLEGGQEDGR
jgi:ATP-binding cassette subfamily B protein